MRHAPQRNRRRRRDRPDPDSGRPAIGWAEWIVGNSHWYGVPGLIFAGALLVVGLRRLGHGIGKWIAVDQA